MYQIQKIVLISVCYNSTTTTSAASLFQRFSKLSLRTVKWYRKVICAVTAYSMSAVVFNGESFRCFNSLFANVSFFQVLCLNKNFTLKKLRDKQLNLSLNSQQYIAVCFVWNSLLKTLLSWVLVVAAVLIIVFYNLIFDKAST